MTWNSHDFKSFLKIETARIIERKDTYFKKIGGGWGVEIGRKNRGLQMGTDSGRGLRKGDFGVWLLTRNKFGNGGTMEIEINQTLPPHSPLFALTWNINPLLDNTLHR